MLDEPIMSVEEARELMGETTQSMTDEAVQDLIDRMDSLARAYVQAVLQGKIDPAAELAKHNGQKEDVTPKAKNQPKRTPPKANPDNSDK